ncbi:ABC transporter permease [Virgisporangium aurantiacum]|uniref:Exporter of polyketide antibiotics n=1 Tax=Virgisporangium aurantiacum TaxID=175570 RepID=A0A8J3Z4B0_9ACTN|nr:ABC antibiotics transporter [Virgisporangium aurantiacum]GIJ54710.1 exporter of polyketide antibiotics [Virgisporangium aurantiacum]
MTATTGLGQLSRLAVRRDRLVLPLWMIGLAAFTAATTALWANDFSDTADLVRETRAAAGSPGIRLLGLASGPSLGAYAMVRNFVLLAVLAALMSIFAVVRHTRQGEETGRAELIGAGPVGRHAALAAALAVTTAANGVLAVLIAVALMVAGQPAGGSITAGAAVAGVGLVFAGVAAVTVQLATSTRAASGLAAAVLGVAFLTSGVGNMTGRVDAAGLRVASTWPAWISPIGWGQQMRPFGGNDWWPLALSVAVFVTASAAGAVLATRRDFALGMLPQRPGRAHAGRALRGPVGLAWRLQRGPAIGWAVGMLGFGVVMGGLVEQVRDATGSARDWYVRMGGSDQIVDAYRSSIMQMAGVAAAIYAVQVLLRMRSEEADGPLEPVLATAVGRVRWAAAHVGVTLLGATALVLVFAGGAGLAAAGALGDPVGQIAPLVRAGLVQLPAIGVLAAAVLVAVAFAHRAAVVVAWSLLLASIVLGPLFGATLGVPAWGRDLSPFTHVPKVPAVPVDVGPIAGLTVVLLMFASAGFVRLRHRDLQLPA